MDEKRIGLILLLLREGSLAEAERTYQEEAGVSRSAARHAVRVLAARNGIASRGDNLWPLALIGLALLAGSVLLIAP